MNPDVFQQMFGGQEDEEDIECWHAKEEGVEALVASGKIQCLFFHFISSTYTCYAGATDKGIGRDSMIEDVLKAYGTPDDISESEVSEFGDMPGAHEKKLSYKRLGITFTFYDRRLGDIRTYASCDRQIQVPSPTPASTTPVLKQASPLENFFRLVLQNVRGSTVLDGHFVNIADLQLAKLKEYPNLQTLDLEGTDVTDKNVVHLKELTCLQTLSLAKTNVTDQGLVHLKALVNLQSLNLWCTDVTNAGLAHLKGLTNLRTLVFCPTRVYEKDLTNLKELKSLQWLDLTAFRVGGESLAPLKELKNLQGLVLYDSEVPCYCLPHLQELKSLQWLDLGGESTGGPIDMAYLKGLTNLQTLKLRHRDVAGEKLAHLKELKNLQTLDLSSTVLGNAELAHLKELKSLQWLDLSATWVEDAGLAHLKGLANLRTLYLNDMRRNVKRRSFTSSYDNYPGAGLITDAGVDDLRKALPACKIVYGD